MAQTELESFKNVTVCTPINQYKRLLSVSKVYGLSISRLAKEGIVLVLEQYEGKLKSNAKECENHKTIQI